MTSPAVLVLQEKRSLRLCAAPCLVRWIEQKKTKFVSTFMEQNGKKFTVASRYVVLHNSVYQLHAHVAICQAVRKTMSSDQFLLRCLDESLAWWHLWCLCAVIAHVVLHIVQAEEKTVSNSRDKPVLSCVTLQMQRCILCNCAPCQLKYCSAGWPQLFNSSITYSQSSIFSHLSVSQQEIHSAIKAIMISVLRRINGNSCSTAEYPAPSFTEGPLLSLQTCSPCYIQPLPAPVSGTCLTSHPVHLSYWIDSYNVLSFSVSGLCMLTSRSDFWMSRYITFRNMKLSLSACSIGTEKKWREVPVPHLPLNSAWVT